MWLKYLMAFLVLLTPGLGVAQSWGFAQSEKKPQPSTLATVLNPGQQVEGDFARDNERKYAINLKTNQYCKILLQRRDLDTEFSVFSPGGELLAAATADDPLTNQQVQLVGREAGEYRLEIRSASESKRGSYTVTVEDLRNTAGERDDQIAAAEKEFATATSLSSKGTKESNLEAIKKYEATLKSWDVLGQPEGQLKALLRLAYIYYQLSSYEDALNCAEKALPIAQSINDPRAQSTVLLRQGFAESGLSRQAKALELYGASLELSRQAGDKGLQGRVLNAIGLANWKLSKFEKAIEYYNQALSIRRELGERADEASTLSNMGLVYSSLGDYQKALDYYTQGLPLSRALGDRSQEGRTLNNTGIAYLKLGQFDHALDYFGQSLKVRQEVGDRQGEANTLGNMGVTYRNLNQYEKALECYTRALEILRAIGDRAGVGNILSNIGVVYRSLGQADKSFQYFNESLPITRAAGNRIQEASTLNNMGLASRETGRLENAVDYYNQALAIERDIGDRSQEAGTINNLAQVRCEMGQCDKAIEMLSESLSLTRTIGERVEECDALNYMAFAYIRLGRNEKALPLLIQAREIAHETGAPVVESRSLDGMASIYKSQGDLELARAAVEESIQLTESVRSEVASDDSRSAFFAGARDRFDLDIEMLAELNKRNPNPALVGKALEASERARARSLLDLVKISRIDINEGVTPEQKAQELSIQAKISQVQSQLIRAHSGSSPDARRIAALSKQLSEADDERQRLEMSLRRSSPRYAELKHPSLLTAREIQKAINPDTLVLEYWLGYDDAFVFAVTNTDLRVIKLAPPASINAEVGSLRESIRSPRRTLVSNYINSAGKLYQELIEPASGLLDGKRRLLIVPDGILHYLPFEVLLREVGPAAAMGSLSNLPFLLRDYSISYAPSISVLALLNESQGSVAGDSSATASTDQRGTVQKDFIGFADPDYREAQRHNEESPLRPVVRGTLGEAMNWKLDPLPASRDEVQKIAGLFPKGKTALFVGPEATEENVKAPGRLSDYRYIHFAVHGMLDESQPQFSSLIFSLPELNGSQSSSREDGLLHMFEVFNLRIRADLVTLSSCETGLGKETSGEGLVGLSRAFFYAGAPSLLVSLWNVDDRSTSELMENFYRGLRILGTGKADALRKAKLSMIRDGRFAHPYYWAPFVLTGRAN